MTLIDVDWLWCSIVCVRSLYRKDGKLPKGVIEHPNGTLAFGRPLNLSDAGTYQCVATNKVGVGKTEVEINVEGRWQQYQHTSQSNINYVYRSAYPFNSNLSNSTFTEIAPKPRGVEKELMFIVGGVAIGLLVLLLTIIIAVTCYHKRKNKKLKRQLTEKKYEIMWCLIKMRKDEMN